MSFPWGHRRPSRDSGIARRDPGIACILAVALGISPGWAGAQVRPPPLKPPTPPLGWCQFADIRTQSVYYTKVFAAAPGAPENAASSAFQAYLKQKYGLSGAAIERPGPVCQWIPQVSGYFVGKMQDKDKSAEMLRSLRVIDTDWAPG